MSLPEVLLRQELRKKAAGARFRRQHPMGPYILDFYCAEAKLVIEVDGISHDMGDRAERDEARDAWLKEQGLKVHRISAKDVLRDPVAVADSIRRLCEERG
ncbi:endonuclease domain-containing protein [Rhizorhabdus dicambivorans]|uniref:DUF559 domain-containing protein n=1 Tax=Rhizorhabdus dicambivorans TaxID=1850238 RepID=A0A2A4G0D0_9SPHN|nr:endonuclease domain-containing protein [Rhizorhabdus dicambivorans]ATE66599.1 DUF559 domain-containing protein [Rhizorhabdus dicambivorans]PCE43918.1 DUF559 domain-containing protein [Rhizorhabdus dicambivorans]